MSDRQWEEYQRLLQRLQQGEGMKALLNMEMLCQAPEAYFQDPDAANPRLESVLSHLEQIAKRDEKALIFATRLEVQKTIVEGISRHFRRPALINGETRHRKALLREFTGRAGFATIVLSPKVAGTGITLTEANHVLHYGRWWNPALEDQATSRVHRIGQKKQVTVGLPRLRAGDRSPDIWDFEVQLDRFVTRKRETAVCLLGDIPLTGTHRSSENEFLGEALAALGS